MYENREFATSIPLARYHHRCRGPPMLTGPRILLVSLILLYAGFLSWYGGSGKPLTPDDAQAYFQEIEARSAGGQGIDREEFFAELRDLLAEDDGREFYMLNLIRFRERALYPPDAPYGDDALAADARYNRAIVPLLLKRAGHPVFLGTPQGRFIRSEGDIEWHRVAMVRYRSRRDFMDMIVELASKDIGIHKWASIEKTVVFPVASPFNLIFSRGLVAVLFIVIGVLLHVLLRRRAFYRANRNS